MKKLKRILIYLIASIIPFSVFGLCGCAELPEGGSISHMVNFIVDGEVYKSIAVNKGDTLSIDKVPQVPDVPGYDLVWSQAQLEDVTQNYIDTDKAVNAIMTPKTYKITYNLGMGESLTAIDGVDYEEGYYVQYVVYGQSYSLVQPQKQSVTEEVDGVPTTYNFLFGTWTDGIYPIALSGVWKNTKDINIIPSWITAVPDYYELIFYHGENNAEMTIVQVDNGDVVDPLDTNGKYYSQLPNLPTETGYTFYWGDREGNEIDFSTIDESCVIMPYKTPKTYTVTFKTSEDIPFMKKVNGTYEKYYEFTQTVKFGEHFTLPKPLTNRYELKNWVIEGTEDVFRYGTWTHDSDYVLEAVWVESDYSLPY